MRPAVLVVAKAPVEGRAKTRLGAEVGMAAAADLAAAALLDTLAVCDDVFDVRYLALEGDLAHAARGAELTEAVAGWVVLPQDGVSFGERLANAHGRVAARGGGGLVQLGMDTPQLTPELLAPVVDAVEDGAAVVIGPATDGGWWVLGLDDGRRGSVLAEVPMSVPKTYSATVQALTADGAAVLVADELRDVDTAADAAVVAALAPATRFAAAWPEHRGVAR